MLFRPRSTLRACELPERGVPRSPPSDMKRWLRQRLEGVGLLAPSPSRVIAPPGTPTCKLESAPSSADAFARYAEARVRSPICHDPGEQCWVVLSHRHVVDAFRRTDEFSSEYTSEFDPFLAASDGHTHHRFRQTLAASIDAWNAESIAAFAREWMHEFAAATRRRGQFDAVRDLGIPLPRAFTCRMLGLTDAERDRIVAQLKPRRSNVNGALQGVGRVLGEIMAAVSGRPRDGAISALVNAPAEARLPPIQIVNMLRHLWFAGTVTLTIHVPAAIAQLCRQPELLETLRADRSLIPAFLSEILRLEPPTHFVRRRCVNDLDFAGVHIKRDALVKLCLASANRDPAAFPSPDELHFDRPIHRHLAFGLGDHFCMGATVARAIAGAALETLVEDFRSLRGVGDWESVGFEASPTFRALLPFRVAVQ